MDEVFKSKMEERNHKAELVRQTKLMLEQEGVDGNNKTNLGPESA